MKIKHLILMIVLVAAMGLAACTRSASEAPTQVPGTDATQATTDQQPPSNMETAVAGGGFATQTAQAAVTTPGEPSTDDPATGTDATPVPEGEGVEPTVAPSTGEDTGTGQEPTAVPPTAPAEPTAVSGEACSSPYTVLAGEWIWSIGRKCNISPQAIIDANNLACYYDLAGRLQCPLYAGDTLVLPANAAPFTGP